MRYIPSLFLCSLLLLAGCAKAQPVDVAVAQDPGSLLIAQAPYTHGGTLRDVTGGFATGHVQARVVEGMFELKAFAEHLPDLQNGDFYEGWIVSESPESRISTGKLIKVGTEYQNSFMAVGDFIDHGRYIVALGPYDGDPAPADHIIEGEIRSLP